MNNRDSFKSKWGFILACIGSAVGMGNIWLFPQRVSSYGGGTFIIPYFIFVFLIASSGVMEEMAFGRAAKSGPVGAFAKAMQSRGLSPKLGEILGYIPVVGSLALAIGYSIVIGWILKYTVGAFTGSTLNPSNLNAVLQSGAPSIAAFGETFGAIARPFGNNAWQVLGILIAGLILAFGIGKGIEKANKMMMPIFFFLFLALGIYVAFQPGAKEGYRYIFSFSWEGFKDPKVWIYAMGQAFFSLSVAGSGTLIYGSYLKDSENIPSSAKNVAIFDTLAAVLAALVIIPAMATTGTQLNSSGPGLMFVHLPNLFRHMPFGFVVTIIFFVSVTFAGLTSLINLYETPIATLQEKLGLSRQKATAIIGSVGIFVSIFIQGIIEQWMNALSIFVCPIGAGLAAVLFYWVYGEKNAKEALTLGSRKPLPAWVFPLGKYVFVALTIIVLIFGALYGGIG